MDTGSAIAKLISAAKLKSDILSTEKMKKVVTLDESVGKFGVGDAGAAIANASLDELAIEQLSHAEGFADFTKEWEEFNILKPVEVVEDFGAWTTTGDADDLSGESGLIVFDFG